MGREVKRVTLDFDWPLNQVWEGYVNPHYLECQTCGGSGETLARSRLGELVGLLMLSGEDAARSRCHPYFNNCGGLHRTRGVAPSTDMTELTAALAGRQPDFLGHDACDRWSATKKILEAAGLSDDWGICKACKGEGIDPSVAEAHAAWSETEPPSGDGWQMWENVSEGSPISPVFTSAEALAQWLADTGASAFGDQTASYDEWLATIQRGWAFSAVGSLGEGLTSGVAGQAALERDRP